MTQNTAAAQFGRTGSELEVRVRFLHPVWKEYALASGTALSAGLDLRACLDVPRVEVPAGDRLAVPAGLAIEIGEPGVAGFVFSRSGLGAKDGLTISQGVGVIDPDYRGEIIVSLLNTSGRSRCIERGQRIAQLVFLPIYAARILAVDALGETGRGTGGFGHTGKI